MCESDKRRDEMVCWDGADRELDSTASEPVPSRWAFPSLPSTCSSSCSSSRTRSPFLRPLDQQRRDRFPTRRSVSRARSFPNVALAYEPFRLINLLRDLPPFS